MLRSQELLLTPLSEPDKVEFMRLVKIIVDSNLELSRVAADASAK